MMDDHALRRKITAILSAGGMAMLAVNCATTETKNRVSPSEQYSEEDTGTKDGDAQNDQGKYEDMTRPLYSVEETD